MDSDGTGAGIPAGKGVKNMKSLFRIIRRYSLTVGMIILVILAVNGCVLLGMGYYIAEEEGTQFPSAWMSMRTMEEIGKELQETDGTFLLSKEGMETLEKSVFSWAMALNPGGNVVWEWQLPSTFSRQYSLQEVAVFSRWYLNGYPVKIWTNDDTVLVFGCDPDKVIRYNVIVTSSLLQNLQLFIKAVILINLLVAAVLILGFGYRFHQTMKPIVQGIESLAAQKPVVLKEKGLAGELAGKLNETSEVLLTQSQALARRDSARTEWIAGVSHDIRTPLSLIVGHSDRLSRDTSLSPENRGLAASIRRQSLLIRQLIADLNLASKLAYQAQPLKKKECLPAALLRSCVSDIYNEEIDRGSGAGYEFDILVREEMEQIQVRADEGLLLRALRNLLGNSVRHNPEGCHVTVSLTAQEEFIWFSVRDTGHGIPRIVVQNLENPDSEVHIMGLRLVDQIAKAHGGRLDFEERAEGSYDARFCISFPS